MPETDFLPPPSSKLPFGQRVRDFLRGRSSSLPEKPGREEGENNSRRVRELGRQAIELTHQAIDEFGLALKNTGLSNPLFVAKVGGLLISRYSSLPEKQNEELVILRLPEPDKIDLENLTFLELHRLEVSLPSMLSIFSDPRIIKPYDLTLSLTLSRVPTEDFFLVKEANVRFSPGGLIITQDEELSSKNRVELLASYDDRPGEEKRLPGDQLAVIFVTAFKGKDIRRQIRFVRAEDDSVRVNMAEGEGIEAVSCQGEKGEPRIGLRVYEEVEKGSGEEPGFIETSVPVNPQGLTRCYLEEIEGHLMELQAALEKARAGKLTVPRSAVLPEKT